MDKSRQFADGYVYHLCNKSIAGYQIFQKSADAKRMMITMDYYNDSCCTRKLSEVLTKHTYIYENLLLQKHSRVADVLAYCVMPDHYHLLIRVKTSDLVSRFVANFENSYTRYFNTKYGRKGPLWQSRFRKKFIKSDQLVAHVTRYIHLNPTTAYLVDRPEDWQMSSYRDYITASPARECYGIQVSPHNHKTFCEDQIDYQRKINMIKKLRLE